MRPDGEKGLAVVIRQILLSKTMSIAVARKRLFALRRVGT